MSDKIKNMIQIIKTILRRKHTKHAFTTYYLKIATFKQNTQYNLNFSIKNIGI